LQALLIRSIGGRWLRGGTPEPQTNMLFFSQADKGGEGESGLGMLTTDMGEACAIAHQP